MTGAGAGGLLIAGARRDQRARSLGIKTTMEGVYGVLEEDAKIVCPCIVFHLDDYLVAVRVAAEDGTEIARGIVNYGSRDLARIVKRRSDEIDGVLGYHFGDEVIHRNDMVLL